MAALTQTLSSVLLGAPAHRSRFHPVRPASRATAPGSSCRWGFAVATRRGSHKSGVGRQSNRPHASTGTPTSGPPEGNEAIHAASRTTPAGGPHRQPQELQAVAVACASTIHPNHPSPTSFLSAAASLLAPLLLAAAAAAATHRVWVSWVHHRQRAHYPDAGMHSGEFFDTSEALGNLAEAMKNPGGPRTGLMGRAHSLALKARALAQRDQPGAGQLEAAAHAVEASCMASIDSEHGDSLLGSGQEGGGRGRLQQDAQVRPQ